MTADRLAQVAIRGYLALFFAYLFLPLGVLVGAAFNASRYPTLVPWEGLTGQWFADLLADRLMGEAAWNSLVVGLGSSPSRCPSARPARSCSPASMPAPARSSTGSSSRRS